MSEPCQLQVVSLNVALPREIGTRRRRPVISGIFKLPVISPVVTVTPTGIVGDGQGDLIAHGGVDKAVYAYPVEHIAPWSVEHRKAGVYGPGTFGENLTVAGLLETEVFIGDRWQWGDVVLEVCQPRYPCYKLGMKLERPSTVREMVANGRTGWYLRVVRAGEAPANGPLILIERTASNVSVAETHAARLPGADRSLVEHVLSEARLASRLREGLQSALTSA